MRLRTDSKACGLAVSVPEMQLAQGTAAGLTLAEPA